MPRGRKGKGAENPTSSIDEVDEMLRAAQDELLLNITRNTHTTARRLQDPLPFSSSSPLDADLARRFEALKAPSLPRGTQPPAEGKPAAHTGDAGGEDDLMARFAALKGSSVPKTGRSDVASEEESVAPTRRVGEEDGGGGGSGGDGAIPKDEVDKVMQWAMDAVRLDISSGKCREDDDEDDVTNNGSGSDSCDTEDEEEEKARRRKKEKGKRGKKWFF